MTEEAETKKARPNDQPADEVDLVLGAWVSGMGFVLLLIGLSVWVRATCDGECSNHCRTEEKEQ